MAEFLATTLQTEKDFVADNEQINEGSEAGKKTQSEPIEGASMSSNQSGTRIRKDENEFPQIQPEDVTTARENLAKEAQQMIEDINSKRRQDTKLLGDFKKTLESHVLNTCKTVEEVMFETYEKQSKIMQAKLQELFATLDRISQIENELRQFKQSLGMFFQDMSEPNIS